MGWKVTFSRKAAKQFDKLPNKVQLIIQLLVKELQLEGPVASQWPNYSKLSGQKGDKRHCHLIKGRPTYVCCWEVMDKNLQLIEVYYVGTHEKAPY